jgi:hypothetical protein
MPSIFDVNAAEDSRGINDQSFTSVVLGIGVFGVYLAQHSRGTGLDYP